MQLCCFWGFTMWSKDDSMGLKILQSHYYVLKKSLTLAGLFPQGTGQGHLRMILRPSYSSTQDGRRKSTDFKVSALEKKVKAS